MRIPARFNIKLPVIWLLSLGLFAASNVEAKPKTKFYNNNAQDVFTAALRTARERHVVTYVDEKNLMFTFQTGQSALSHGFVANASLEPIEPNKTNLIINVQNKGYSDGKVAVSYGAGGRMADKFFEQVAEELARQSKQTLSVKPEAPAVVVPPPLVSNSAKTVTTDIATVLVVSVPEGADISVDDAFVGNSPATLKLSQGKHDIRVSQNGYKTWNREVSTLTGSEVRLNATLEKIP
jgi:hypothetical protein